MKPYFADREAWIVSCYYNPLRFHSRRRNFDIFYRQLKRSRVPFLILECAFGADHFELEPSQNVLQLRARDVLWQKERLINLAVRLLPRSAKYVIWLDADILFANPRWILETVAVLQKTAICQPFSRVVRLAPRQTEPAASNREVWDSFAFVWKTNPEKAHSDKD